MPRLIPLYMSLNQGSDNEGYINYYQGKDITGMFNLPQSNEKKKASEHGTMLRSKSRVEKTSFFKKTLRQMYDEVYGQKKESIIRANIQSLEKSVMLPFSNNKVNLEEITLFLVCFQLPLRITYFPNEVNKDKVCWFDAAICDRA